MPIVLQVYENEIKEALTKYPIILPELSQSEWISIIENYGNGESLSILDCNYVSSVNDMSCYNYAFAIGGFNSINIIPTPGENWTTSFKEFEDPIDAFIDNDVYYEQIYDAVGSEINTMHFKDATILRTSYHYLLTTNIPGICISYNNDGMANKLSIDKCHNCVPDCDASDKIKIINADRLFSSNITTGGTYEAPRFVICDKDITTSSQVNFKAFKGVFLEPGFSVQNNFQATIDNFINNETIYTNIDYRYCED